MTLLVEKGTFTKTTSTAAPVDQTVTLSNGSLTPKLVILWTTGQTTSNGTYVDDARISYGFSDGTNDACQALRSDESAELETYLFNNNCVISIINLTSNAEISRGDISSFGAGNFHINWSTQSDTNAMVIHYIVAGGTDITNVSVVNTTVGSTGTGNLSFNGSGTTFTPDFALCMTGADGYATANNLVNSTDQGLFCIGAAKSTSARWTMWGRIETAANSDTDMYLSPSACLASCSTSDGTITFLADFVSFNSAAGGGITVNVSDGADATTKKLAFLLVKGAQWDCGAFQQRNGTGTQDVTIATGLDPEIVFLGGINTTNSATVTANHYIGLGASDGTNEGCTYFGSTNGLGTWADVNTNLNTKVYRIATPNATASSSTTNAECDMTGMSTSGQFTLDWTTADATQRRMAYWTVGAALERIEKSQIYKWHLDARVSLSRIYKYHIVGRISNSRIYKWHINARTSLSRIYKWHLEQRVSLSRIYKWHLEARASLSRIYKYNIQSRVSLARTYLWNILEGLERIEKSQIYKWNINARVSLSRIYKYHIQSRVSLSRIYLWHVLARVSQSRIYKWHMQSRTSLSRIYKWHLEGRVSLARSYLWNIVGRVSLNRIYKYHIQARVSLSRIYKYHLEARVSLSRIYKWHLIGRVSLSRSYLWNIIGRVSLSRIYKYHVQSRVSLARTYLWNIVNEGLDRISKSQIYKWHIIGRISLSRVYKYHVQERVSLTRLYKWNMQARVELSRIYLWHIMGRISLMRTYAWNVIGRISLSRIYKYHIQSRVSLSRTYLWNIVVGALDRVSKSQIYKWHILSRVSLNRIYKWAITVTETFRTETITGKSEGRRVESRFFENWRDYFYRDPRTIHKRPSRFRRG